MQGNFSADDFVIGIERWHGYRGGINARSFEQAYAFAAPKLNLSEERLVVWTARPVASIFCPFEIHASMVVK